MCMISKGNICGWSSLRVPGNTRTIPSYGQKEMLTGVKTLYM